MGIKGTHYVASFSLRTSSSKSKVIHDGRKRNDMFHLRVISKNTNIDALVDSGSQLNFISEKVVKNFELETRPHLR
jgi:hypothetical protein